MDGEGSTLNLFSVALGADAGTALVPYCISVPFVVVEQPGVDACLLLADLPIGCDK